MQNFGVKLTLAGIFVIVISGLERVLIFMTFQGRVTDSLSLKAMTPSSIWNVPAWTLTFGIVLFVIGILLVISRNNYWKQMKQSFENIKKNNDEYRALIERGSRNE